MARSASGPGGMYMGVLMRRFPLAALYLKIYSATQLHTGSSNTGSSCLTHSLCSLRLLQGLNMLESTTFLQSGQVKSFIGAETIIEEEQPMEGLYSCQLGAVLAGCRCFL